MWSGNKVESACGFIRPLGSNAEIMTETRGQGGVAATSDHDARSTRERIPGAGHAGGAAPGAGTHR